MGGKKKTKWRKVPIEEFTKEISATPDKVPSSDACQTDLTREENNCIQPYNEPSENAQNYTESYEYIDDLWYPSSCVLYNPVEVYSNYMMPVDTCYYYYTMPEIPQVQECVPMSCQEYTSTLPKDTVYLLFPAQAIRDSQPVQNLAPVWQTRRRRRYEGYAEYAVIPDRPNSTKSEVGDRNCVTGQLPNSGRNSAHSNNLNIVTSERSKFYDYNSVLKQNPSSSKSNDMNKISKLSSDGNSVKGPMSVNEEMQWLSKESAENNRKYKNLEMCTVHSITTVTNDPETLIKTNSMPSLKNENKDVREENKENDKISVELVSDISSSSFCADEVNNISDANLLLNKKKGHANNTRQQEKSDKINDMTQFPNEVSGHDLPFLDQRNNVNKTTAPKPNENIAADMNSKMTKDVAQKNSQCSVPDILKSVNKQQLNEKKREPYDSLESPLTNEGDINRGHDQKLKTLSSETSHFQNILNAGVLQNEMEVKELHSVHSLPANQYIYKLAYNTDQSEKDSKSPSPIDPQSQIPSSHFSNEIYVEDGDSDFEPGYDEVDPHRYESETSRNECKHIFINKLSLAAELLRTNETLPYDAEFKRIVDDNESDFVPAVHTGKKVKHVFVDDPYNTNVKDSPQYQFNLSTICRNNNDVFRDTQLESIEVEELCESVKEDIAKSSETEDNTDVRPACGRFMAQARGYFFPRVAFPLDPRYCCIIM